MDRRLSKREQDHMVSEFLSNLDASSSDAVDAVYEQLDDDHKAELYEGLRDYANNAVGDEHWDDR